MLRTKSGRVHSKWVAAAVLASAGAVLWPVPAAAQDRSRARVRVPAVRTAPPAATRRPAGADISVRSPVVRQRTAGRTAVDARRTDQGDRRDDRADRRDDRNDRRDDRGDRRDDRNDRRDDGFDRRDTRFEARGNGWGVRDTRFDNPGREWRRVRRSSDLQLFGFLNIDVRWNRWDRADRGWWVARYDRYDGRGRFHRGVTGWYAPRWNAIRFDRNPLGYGPRGLDDRDLRRVLGSRTLNRIASEVGVRRQDLWGRVERFGPGGRAYTLEIWTRDRFVAALTDFDRDGWVDSVEVNGRFHGR